METGDEWLAADKIQHLLACFIITLIVTFICRLSRYAVLRRRSAALGSLAGLVAGAAKEAGDEIGFWRSTGASPKDAAADLLGIALAALFLALYRRLLPPKGRERDRDGEISMV